MPYVLGIDIGGSNTTAAVSRLRETGWGRPEVVRLGSHTDSVPSALHVGPDGAVTVAQPRQLDGDRVARGFSRRIGDDVPMIVAGEPCPPQALTAVMAMWVAEQVSAQQGEPAEQVVIGHPAGWGAYRRSLLRRALREIGMGDVTLLPEPVLAAESHAARGPVGDTLAVYSLGGSDFEASVVHRGEPDCFRVGTSATLADRFGGADLDEALVNHVATALGGQFRELRRPGPQARLARYGLHRECVRAKEELATASETEVRVPMPGGTVPVPVSRSELSELVRPALRVTVEALAQVVAAGAGPDGIDGVLLVGGAAQLPLVAELVTAELPAPVAMEPDPQATAATGAAVVAAKIASPPARPRGKPGRARREPVDPPVPRQARDSARGRELDAPPPPRPPVKVAPLRLSGARSGPRRFGLVGGRS